VGHHVVDAVAGDLFGRLTRCGDGVGDARPAQGERLVALARGIVPPISAPPSEVEACPTLGAAALPPLRSCDWSSADAVRDIATVMGRRLGLPAESVPQENFGPLGPIFAMDQPASSAHTRDVLGWPPSHPGLLADLENVQP
jgi:hypothetical protein